MSSLKASLLPPYMLPTGLVVPCLRSTRTFAFYIRQVLCPNRTQLPHPGLVPQPTWGAAALTPFTSAAPFNSRNSGPALAASFPARFFTSTKPAPVSQTASVPHLSSEKLTQEESVGVMHFSLPAQHLSAQVKVLMSFWWQKRPPCCCCHSFTSQDNEERVKGKANLAFAMSHQGSCALQSAARAAEGLLNRRAWVGKQRCKYGTLRTCSC